MREKIYNIIEVGTDDTIGKAYDFLMMITIIISIIPLCVHGENQAELVIDIITVSIFIIDYLLRLITADYKLKEGKKSFVKYPFTAMAVIDLISILPSLSIINRGYKLVKVVRLIRTFRIFRVFKTFRYSKNIMMIVNVLKRQKDSLFAVCIFAFGYIFIAAIVMFNVEPETFPTIFEALYWATISLTTVGYGDVYAVTTIGKAITMLTSVLGVAVVTLPAGVIIAGYQEELNKMKQDDSEE